MGVCDVKKIKKNLNRCGERALAKGVQEMIYLGMKTAQKIAFTLDTTTTTLITGIAMAVGEMLFAYEGYNYSNDVSVNFKKTDYSSSFPQTLTILLFSNSPATKAEIESLVTRKDLVVFYKREAGDYEVLGVNTGMRVADGGVTYKPNDENKGAFVITFEAPEEPELPKTLRHTATVGGLDDTDTYLAALVTPNV